MQESTEACLGTGKRDVVGRLEAGAWQDNGWSLWYHSCCQWSEQLPDPKQQWITFWFSTNWPRGCWDIVSVFITLNTYLVRYPGCISLLWTESDQLNRICQVLTFLNHSMICLKIWKMLFIFPLSFLKITPFLWHSWALSVWLSSLSRRVAG